MNAEYASETTGEQNWNNINWNKVQRDVRLLQQRIVKAEQKKQYRKVKSLQFILTRSFAAKLLAVKKVTENKGKRTPGVDHQLWSTAKAKMECRQKPQHERLQGITIKKCKYSQSKWKNQTTGDSNDAGQSVPSSLSDGFRAVSGSNSRLKFLRIPIWKKLCRCYSTMLYCIRKKARLTMDIGG